jgi:hypothetical protein
MGTKEAADQMPDRAISLDCEKKVRPNRDASLGDLCATTLRHFDSKITQF